MTWFRRQLFTRCEGRHYSRRRIVASIRNSLAAAAEISGLNWKWVKLIKCQRRRATSLTQSPPRDLASLRVARSCWSPPDNVISSETGVVSPTRYLMTSQHRQPAAGQPQDSMQVQTRHTHTETYSQRRPVLWQPFQRSVTVAFLPYIKRMRCVISFFHGNNSS